jgi:endonuclease/exonuclease/phosphatase family metal-dependent hydrolase
MKLKFSLLLILIIIIKFSISAQTLTVATYNLRYDNRGDSGNLWVNRAPIQSNLIRFHDFDVVGIQEGLINQLEDLSKSLPQYTRYGIGRDDGKAAGEHSAIYYKKDKFKLLKRGDFWLSQTPDQPGKGWDATCCNRICSWVQLQDIASKKIFYFFNVHFDHQGVIARIESAKLMIEKIKTIAGNTPAVFTGDLNGGRNSDCYKYIANAGVIKDSYDLAGFTYENNGSFNSFRTPRGIEVIDHIFVTKKFTVKKWGILTDTYFGKYPSDHFPVMAVVSF